MHGHLAVLKIIANPFRILSEEKRTLHIHALSLFPVLSHQGHTFRLISVVLECRHLGHFSSALRLLFEEIDSSHLSDPLLSESRHSFKVWLRIFNMHQYLWIHDVRESVYFLVVNVSALPLSSCQVVLPLCLSSFSSNWHGPTAATLKALAQPEISSAKRQRLMLNHSPQRWLLSHQEGVILSVCLLTPTKFAYSFSQCPCYPKKANKAVGDRAK